MDVQATIEEIKKELDSVKDEKVLWAIARILNLNSSESPDWHRQMVEERFVEYERNPQNVIGWEELKKKWKDEL